MSTHAFTAAVMVLTALGIVVPARRNRLFAIPATIIFGITALLLVWFGGKHRIVDERVPAAGLTAPLRIVHLSDIHVGTFMGDWRLGRMARQINALKPDLILATGDFVTVRSERDYSPLLRFFRALERPRLGVYGCLGNHDLPVAKRLLADLEAAGVRMLVNEGETIATEAGPLRIAGLTFYWRDRRALYRKAFEKAAPGSEPVLLLCHDPAAFDCLPENWSGVMFAGHLHGGQIGLTSLGLRWSVLKPFGMYDQGVFTRGRAAMYVHRGTGVYGFPVRLGVPAEVAVITLAPPTEPAQGVREKSSASGASES